LEKNLNRAIFAQASLSLVFLAAPPPPAMAQGTGTTTPQIAKPSDGSAANVAPVVDEPPSVSKGMHLYRDGRYYLARAEYNRVI
jgi:hypothetical protein